MKTGNANSIARLIAREARRSYPIKSDHIIANDEPVAHIWIPGEETLCGIKIKIRKSRPAFKDDKKCESCVAMAEKIP